MITALALLILDPNYALPETVKSDELEQRGEQLHAALVDRLNQLADTHDLPRANSEHKDVSDIFARFIPVGTPFLDAEKILRAAQADMADMPPRPARSIDPEYDRFDILGGIPLYQRSGVNAHAAVKIYPDRTADPKALVQKVEASIAIDAL